MNAQIDTYNESQEPHHRAICHLLATQIQKHLPHATGKIWHAHPVWFLDNNPLVGYSKQKPGIRLMFWSGADFNEPALDVLGKRFKHASIFLNHPAEIDTKALARWLKKAERIQWDYANIAKRKGRLERLR